MIVPLDTANLKLLDAFGFVAGSWVLYRLWKVVRSKAKQTKLKGPRSSSWLFGVTNEVFDGDSGDVYEAWAKQYGKVYQIPGAMGQRRLVITDPKAIAHCWAKTYTYRKTKASEQGTLLLVSTFTNYRTAKSESLVDREGFIMG